MTTVQKEFKAGDTIMVQGEPGTSAFIIEKGRVDILIKSPNDETHSVGTRGEGTIIGEMALFDNAPRTATVQAVEDCLLLEITKEDFSRRLESADPVLRMTSQVILTRYRDMLARAKIMNDGQNWPPAEAIELNYAEKTNAVEKIKIANDFEHAIKNNELSLHYQPIIDLATGAIKGFEALMRWEHPEKGNIYPDIFIPIAEETGLIVDASKWALEEACMALKRIESRCGFDNDLFMSVNFSSHDFAADGFVETVYETISKTDVKPNLIHLEITERLLMSQPENARETLELCQKSGLHISIDDFGTGYSSLSYLHHFPIDTLKIDRSFVKDMLNDNGAMALVKSIIGLAKNMNMNVIAEGVENKNEGLKLKDLGCEMAQGYYFARPAPEKEITDLIRTKGDNFYD